jgi:hypothetical protein
MDTKQQTKVTNQNKINFFQTVYHHQSADKNDLVDLESIDQPTIILIDCCGWYYKKMFPQKSIIGFETVKTVKDFELDQTYFDRLIDNQADNRIGWPSLTASKCAVVFDRSPLLKYLTLQQISNILDKISNKYMPDTIVLEQSLIFIDDARLVDRFYTVASLAIDNYIVNQFNYNTDKMHLSVRFQKKINTL